MILYILQKGYTTKIAKGVDELNALSLEGCKFVKAIEQPDPEESEPEGKKEPEEPNSELVCDLCGKKYKSEHAYLKHIKTCKG